MRKLTFILLFFAMAIIAYSYTSKTSTPKVLQSSSTDRSYGDVKGGRGNILDQLFTEARRENDELDKTYTKIQDLHGELNDQRAIINKYLSTNQSYYTAAKNEAKSIVELALKEETLALINSSEQAFLSKKRNAESYLEKIAKSKQGLDDHLSLLKIKVTNAMIQNYQKNEEPVDNELKELIKKTDQLIKEIKSSNW